jgi:type II secretory pathway pseudopilin PulG
MCFEKKQNSFSQPLVKCQMSNVKCRSGFTVIEMIIATALFVTVIGVVSGLFVQALKTQRIAQGLMAVNSNVSFAIEQLSREVRTGFNFCPTSDEDTCTSEKFIFTNAKNEKIVYALGVDRLMRSVNGAPFEPITGDEVKIDQLNFLVTGERADDDLQPLLTMSMAVSSNNPLLQDVEAVTHLEVSVSSRVPED